MVENNQSLPLAAKSWRGVKRTQAEERREDAARRQKAVKGMKADKELIKTRRIDSERTDPKMRPGSHALQEIRGSKQQRDYC